MSRSTPILAMTTMLGLLATTAPAQAPGTEIHLVPLRMEAGALRLGPARNVTQRPGYDNQPSFTPSGEALLFTSIRDDQADIYRYELESGRTERLTATAESEYSPTVVPTGDEFSAVRVEADSTQRLWAFPREGGKPRVLLPEVRPVGYHAWGDERTLVLFVLGAPPTLRVADLRTGRATRVDENIGRSLQPIPGARAVSYVHKRAPEEWWIVRLDLGTGTLTPLVRTLPGSEDHVWTPDGTILMGHEATIHAWRPGSAGWTEVGRVEGAGSITRLAVSPAGEWLAVVGEETSGDR